MMPQASTPALNIVMIMYLLCVASLYNNMSQIGAN
jgi:hypothetical protein